MLENKEKKNLIRKKYIKIRNSIANKYAKSNVSRTKPKQNISDNADA